MKTKRLAGLLLLLCLISAAGTRMLRSADAKIAATTPALPRANILEEPSLEIDLDESESPHPIITSANVITASISDADWMAEGNQTSAHLGSSVASAGDVNGDGYDDVIVGVPGYRYAQWASAGAVFVWYGSPSGLGVAGNPSNADWQVLNDQGGNLGHSVGTAGDVNNDGYDDVIVGAPTFHIDELNLAGAAFVWYGSDEGLGGDGTTDGADWVAHGNQSAAWFGESVTTAGDVDKDGYDDIIVGASYHDNDQIPSAGAAFVWHGSLAGLGATGTISNTDWLVQGDQENARTGLSVSTAGDVNGDGFDDVIVGAYGYDNDGFDFPGGAAFVWHGSESGLGPDGTQDDADWMADGDKSDARYGVSVGTAGDVNGDGYDDVIVGAPGFDNDLIDRAGAAFVWHGSAAGLGATGSSDNADWTVLGDQHIGLFGWSVGSAGDVNNDGYDDAIMGSHGYGSSNGICLVFNGSADGLLPRSLAWSVEPSERIKLGFSVGTAGM
jgi:hypothetical protein